MHIVNFRNMRQEAIAVNTTDHRMTVMYIIIYYGRINSKKKKDEEEKKKVKKKKKKKSTRLHRTRRSKNGDRLSAI